MFTSLNLLQKGLLLISIPLILELGFLGWTTFFVIESDNAARQADVASLRMASVSLLSQRFIEIALTLILYGVTHNSLVEERFNSHMEKAAETFKQVTQSFGNDPENQALISDFKNTMAHALELIAVVKKDMESSGIQDMAILKQSNPARTECFAVISRANQLMTLLVETEHQRQIALNGARTTDEHELQIGFIVGFGVSLLSALALARVYNTNIVTRLGVIIENCRRFSTKQELLPALGSDDEIACLDDTFHKTATEIAEADRREQSMVEDAVDVITTLANDGTIRTINRSFSRLWSKARADVLGSNILDAVVDDQRPMLLEILNESSPGKFVIDVEMVTSNENVLSTRWTINRLPEKSVCFCVIRDVSLEKETERLKNHFVSMVTHDLRTPLTSVNNLLSLLEQGAYGTLSTETSENVQGGLSDSTRLIKIISDYLDLEKMNAGAFKFDFEVIDLSSILTYIEDEAHVQSLNVVDKTRGTTLLADASMLSSAIEDILTSLPATGETVEVILTSTETQAIITLKARLASNLLVALTSPFEELFGKFEDVENQHFDRLLKLSRAREILHSHNASLSISQNISSLEVCLPKAS